MDEILVNPVLNCPRHRPKGMKGEKVLKLTLVHKWGKKRDFKKSLKLSGILLKSFLSTSSTERLKGIRRKNRSPLVHKGEKTTYLTLSSGHKYETRSRPSAV